MSRRTRLVIRLALALFVMTGVSISRSNPHPTDSMGAWVPADLRDRVHLRVSELPTFPDHKPPGDVRVWPKRISFDGEEYDIRLSETAIDVVHSLASPNEITPGRTYDAYYGRVDSKGRLVARGPSSSWFYDGRVMHHGYNDASRTDVWGYDPAGRVVMYVYRRPLPREAWSCEGPRHEQIQEWFDSSGKLIGLRVGTEQYWAGLRRTDAEYSRLVRSWDPWRAIQDSVYKARRRNVVPSP